MLQLKIYFPWPLVHQKDFVAIMLLMKLKKRIIIIPNMLGKNLVNPSLTFKKYPFAIIPKEIAANK